MRQRDAGFTLAEIMIALVIVAVLSAIAVPLFVSQNERAEIASLKSDLINAITLLEEGRALGDPDAILPDVFPADTVTEIPLAGSLAPNETIHVTGFDSVFCVDGTTNSGYALAYSRETGFREGTCTGPGPDPDPTPSPTPTSTESPSPSPSPTSTVSPSPSPTINPDEPGVWRDAIFVPAKYTCPVGATLDGTDCVTKDSIPGYYSCPNGGNLVGDKCETSVYVPGYTYYTCPTDYPDWTLSGSTCTRETFRRTCPNGGTLWGTDCRYISGYKCDTSGYPAGDIIEGPDKNNMCSWYAWVCPNGWNRVTNSLCSREYGPFTSPNTCSSLSSSLGYNNGYPVYSRGSWTPATTETTYSCPGGWTKSGTTCSKTTTNTTSGTLGNTLCSSARNSICPNGSWSCDNTAPRPWSCTTTSTQTQPATANTTTTPGYCTYYTNDYAYNAVKTYRSGFAATEQWSLYPSVPETYTISVAATANTSPGYWTTQSNPATWNPPVNKDTRVPATFEPERYECEPGGSLSGTRCFYPYG